MAVSKRLRFEVFRRDNFRCRYCGATPVQAELRVDHVVPEALGGNTDPSNLVTACDGCNSGKSSIAPDSPIVDDVRQDALRWSLALAVVADRMLADLEAKNALRSTFETKWNAWTFSDGNTVPLPNSWVNSVDNFMAAGLPIEVLLDCLDKAMRVEKLKPENVFRYMCGIAWGRVTEMQESTREQLGESAAGGDEDDEKEADPYEYIRGQFDETDLERAAAEARHWGEDVPEDDPTLSDVVTRWALDGAMAERNRLVRAAGVLLSQLPDEEAAQLQESAKRLLEKYTPPGLEPARPYVLAGVLDMLAGQHACEWLNRRPAKEAEEWLAGATAQLPHRPAHDVAIRAATNARMWLQDGKTFIGMCPTAGEHGARCPRVSAFTAWFANCDLCVDQECKGHPAWCERHMELVVDGVVQSKRDLINYEPIKATDPWDF